MTIELWYIDNIQNGPYKDLESEYLKRLNYFYKTEIKQFKPVRHLKDPEMQIKSEEELLLANLSKKKRCLILLDEHGLQFKSRPFAQWLNQNIFTQSVSPCFIVGGAYGFSEFIKTKADFKISLSSFTFSHKLARIVLLEQLYRACTILHNHPYHND